MSNNKGELTDYFQLRKGAKQKNILQTKPREQISESDSEPIGSDTEDLNKTIINPILRDPSDKISENSSNLNNIENLNSKNMGTQGLKISEALKIIDPFDGSPTKLHKFLA